MPTTIPYLRLPCSVQGSDLHFGHRAPGESSAAQRAVASAVFEGGRDVRDLAELHAAVTGGDAAASEPLLRAAFLDDTSLVGCVDVDAPEEVDILMVEQGYGGVYVHSVELLRQLRSRWRCLLLSPVEPLFEPDPLPDVITLEGLQRERPDLDYLAWIQVVRTLVARTRARLVLLMHRSQALYLFDVLEGRNTVIYCDGFYDGAFKRAFDFGLEPTPERMRKVLAEVLYAVANEPSGLQGIAPSPGVNLPLLMAGAYSLRSARENWCWGEEQRTHFVHAFPELEDSIRLMLPFVDPGMFDPARVARERRVLFTTTMHNIEKKGLPELVTAMKRLADVRVRCVVRQPERLPPIPPKVAARMEMGKVTKPEMVELYHRMWVNFRVSRDESSPVSILESMACELPQIVSTTVAEQIPIIEDGATGFVVHPDDGERAVWALRTILGDPLLRDRMGRECRRRVSRLAFQERVAEFERVLA